MKKKCISHIVIVFVFFMSSTFFAHDSHAIKIVAVVNETIITDYDVNRFEKTLCQLDNRFKCNSPESKQVALVTLVDSHLKSQHFEQIGIDTKQFKNDFKEHEKHVLSSIKKNKNDISEQFSQYLFTEYIWGFLVSMRARSIAITDEDVNKYAVEHKMKVNKNNSNNIKNAIFQQRINEQSISMMDELKKLYLVDIKG